ncbi:MAG: IS1182 family transposase [Dehalococcoidia bacterium]
MPSIIPTDRSQLTFMNSLDDMVAPDHPVRLLDALIDRIIASDPDYFNHLAPQSSAGRRGYPAGALLKLLMYGYIHGVNSSRKLQGEAQRNIEVIWLIKSLTPCYKTIADYRKDHPGQIERVNEQVVRFLVDNQWISGERIGIDGTKLKAYTGWDMSDKESLDNQLATAHKKLEQWMQKLALNDLRDEIDELDGDDVDGGTPSEVLEQIDKLHEKIRCLEELKKELERQQAPRISPADPDARLMKSARGGKYPAYNLQAAVDSDHQMIVVGALTQESTDFELLEPMVWASAARLEREPAEVLADTGYADLGDIQRIQQEGAIRCYVPENDAPKANQSITFDYKPGTDTFECSQGRPLEPVAKGRYNKRKDAYMDHYRGTECSDCPVVSQCTSAKDGVRTLTVFHGADWREQYRRQLASRYGRERIAERKELVEHIFGTLRYWMGHIPLKLRGLAKVQTEINLYTAGYNIKRWTGLAGFDELMEQVKSWSPAPRLQPG